MKVFNIRKSYIVPELTYFYTVSIKDFIHLLSSDEYKNIVLNSLKYLAENKLITIYAFVIMPNHIHLIWRINKYDNKESPQGSFLKFTAHSFKKNLSLNNAGYLQKFAVKESDRKYRFWNEDPLAIVLTSEKALLQKLEYIHMNPCREKWRLAELPEEYYWSSASYYLNNKDNFDILTHYKD